MSETRLWTEYEDLILKRLREEDKIQKWTVVAQMMADEYNLKGRNGKQCKERYIHILYNQISVDSRRNSVISVMGLFTIAETFSTA